MCGLARCSARTSGAVRSYRQRVDLGRRSSDPPILIWDQPTSDLDPNEKAEVLKYIKEIGKDHTILLSTHNLAEVEEACARAIIVSKGRVVADGPLDDIRGKSGGVRYFVTVDEQKAEKGSAPKSSEIEEGLKALAGATRIKSLPTDEKEHKFELSGPQSSDLRPELFTPRGAEGLDPARAAPRYARKPGRGVPDLARRREARSRRRLG